MFEGSIDQVNQTVTLASQIVDDLAVGVDRPFMAVPRR